MISKCRGESLSRIGGGKWEMRGREEELAKIKAAQKDHVETYFLESQFKMFKLKKKQCWKKGPCMFE